MGGEKARTTAGAAMVGLIEQKIKSFGMKTVGLLNILLSMY